MEDNNLHVPEYDSWKMHNDLLSKFNAIGKLMCIGQGDRFSSQTNESFCPKHSLFQVWNSVFITTLCDIVSNGKEGRSSRLGERLFRYFPFWPREFLETGERDGAVSDCWRTRGRGHSQEQGFPCNGRSGTSQDNFVREMGRRSSDGDPVRERRGNASGTRVRVLRARGRHRARRKRLRHLRRVQKERNVSRMQADGGHFNDHDNWSDLARRSGWPRSG